MAEVSTFVSTVMLKVKPLKTIGLIVKYDKQTGYVIRKFNLKKD